MGKEFNIAEQFLKELKNSNDKLSYLYYSAFSCMDLELLEKTLKSIDLDDVNWFYDLHKSMRQCDFSGNVHVSYIEDLTDDSDKNRLKELLTILPVHSEKGWAWRDVVKIKQAEEMGLHSELKEYRSIKSKMKTEKNRSISGHIDMILWELIHLDNNRFLESLIKRFLKINSIHEKK